MSEETPPEGTPSSEDTSPSEAERTPETKEEPTAPGATASDADASPEAAPSETPAPSAEEQPDADASPEAAPSEAPAPSAEEQPDADVSPEAAPSETPASAEAEQTPEAAPEPAEPVAEEPVAEEPVASPEPEPAPAATPESEPAPAAEQPGGEPEAPAAAAQQPAGEDEEEEVPETPRVRPEIPGADLIPDVIPEGEEFLDAESRAAAEAEAEARAEREREEREQEEQSQPIADAAIDLAAGARYTSTGKRKTAVARVILKPGEGTYAINGKQLDHYFPRETLRRVIRQPLETVGYDARMDVIARMHGGGVAAQAEALRHGISRALIVADPNLRGELKRRGFLTRDPRVKERKKAGLKKARKRPQFSKR